MEKKDKISRRVLGRWPIIVVALGILLSIAWLILLIWYPLHLLSIV
jgi:hypothetical protein